jgi:hypothetical protein
MKRLLPATLLLALAAGACDSPTNGPRVDRVVVTPDVRNLNAGDSARLSATARDETSQVVENVRFQWTSLEPAIATVTQEGMVTGLRTGTARIEVSAREKADTAVITVFGTAAECDAPSAGISLGVGQTVQRQGANASVLCLEGGGAGAEFTIIPFNGTPTPGSSLTVQATGASVSPPAGPPSPSVSPSLSGGLADDAGVHTHDGGFHTRLNQRAANGPLRGMAASARAAYRGPTAGGARMQVSAAPPAVGTLLNLNASTEACSQPKNVVGRVAAVSQRAIVVADTANPAGGLTNAEYAHVAATFDTLVYPVNVANFGEPQDVDQNGRVIILYTRKVNELTPANANYLVGGFFYARDLFPREPASTAPYYCTTSNYAEIFYMLAADPNGAVNGNQRSVEDVFKSTVGVVGHEFQHLINASRRLYVTKTDDFDEEVYLNEGLSHIAEELLFYHRARLSPRMNLGPSNLPTGSAARASLDLFGEQNERRYQEYLRNPETRTPYNDNDELGDRGAAWAFLRYLADRRNGNDQQLWMALVNNDKVGLDNLREVLGQDPIPFFRDFAVSVYTDDAVAGLPAIFTQPSWNQRALLSSVYAIYGGFSLKVRPLTSGSEQSFSLTAGGAAYLRAAVAPGRRASITVRSDGPLDEDVWVTVVRTK